jgi:uncharacterized BrkB/YihY/UPF0761 family membrane protein
MYNIHNIYFKNYSEVKYVWVSKQKLFSIGTTIITILNILLVILVVYIIKLISNHFSKVKQLEKDVVN